MISNDDPSSAEAGASAPSLDEALSTFLTTTQTFINKENARLASTYTNVEPDLEELSAERGQKWAKIVIERKGQQWSRSVFCFVALVDSKTRALGEVKAGDVHKAAGWKAPAKHARGSIFSDSIEGYGVTRNAAGYIR